MSPLLELVFTKMFDAIWRHWTIHWMMKQKSHQIDQFNITGAMSHVVLKWSVWQLFGISVFAILGGGEFHYTWLAFQMIYFMMPHISWSLQWCHNDHDVVSNHQPHGCLLNRLFRRRSKKTSKLRVTGLCVGNSPGPVNSPHKWPVTRKMFPFDDVIMWCVHSDIFVAQCVLKFGDRVPHWVYKAVVKAL